MFISRAKRTFGFCAGLALAVVIYAVLRLSTSTQPSSAGKPLTYWFRQLPLTIPTIRGPTVMRISDRFELYDHRNYAPQRETPVVALAAIRNIGTNGLPLIMRRLRANHPVHMRLNDWASRLGFRRAVFPAPLIDRAEATTALLALVPLPPETVTELQQLRTNASPASVRLPCGPFAAFVLEMNANTNDWKWQSWEHNLDSVFP